MKKIIFIILVVFIMSLLLTGCTDEVNVKKGKGLHQEVTGATIVFDYTDTSGDLLDEENGTG